MHNLTRVFALVLLASSLQLPASSHAAEPVWSVKGKQNTVYLLGSVHFLNAAEKLPAAADAAYVEAEKLVMEIDLDDLDARDMQQATLELGLLPDNQTLEAQLGPEVYARVAAHARELGVDPALLNRLRPWFAALTLVQMHLMKMGLDPNSGVEQRLAARAATDGKPIEGLETIREQLGLLASLPDAQQREFLLYSVDDAARATREIDALLAAWRRGDAAALATLLSEGFDQFPDLYRPLTVERNRKWLADLTDLLDDRDDYLVVVGALHLVGEDSVVELLRGKGYKVTQH
jgi:uncharacterized protein YbaP (TraB family)